MPGNLSITGVAQISLKPASIPIGILSSSCFIPSLLYYWNRYYSRTTIKYRFIGKVVGLITILAGILDIVENLGMFKKPFGKYIYIQFTADQRVRDH
ncbi:MAG: hypothetical protein IPL55_00120 [Saprospiraceae bacterium]|nr:hypothetical protein [Saprospiraceae bacterium]